MDPRLGGLYPPVRPVGGSPAEPAGVKTRPAAAQPAAAGKSFKAVLQGEIRAQEPLRFSAHAEARLRMAGVQMSEADLARLRGAVEKAAAKGARESLILMDQMAFVVSVRNRTVITAIHQQRAKENVFTQIDSAVII